MLQNLANVSDCVLIHNCDSGQTAQQMFYKDHVLHNPTHNVMFKMMTDPEQDWFQFDLTGEKKSETCYNHEELAILNNEFHKSRWKLISFSQRNSISKMFTIYIARVRIPLMLSK